MSVPRPLAGITVVSLEQAVAAPFATRQLADLGARVIKVERDTGDFARGYDTTVRGMSSYFVWLNRSKESVVLDLKSSEGVAVLTGLVSRADVFIQNLGPGVVDRLGFGATALLARHPALIHASISGYGGGGDYQDRKAYDLMIQCEAGLVEITGTPEHQAKVGVSIADIAAGMYAYSGILGALIQRGRTGRGDALEISMLEALGEWMTQPYYYTEYGGRQQPRTGAEHATIAPYGPFSTADTAVFFGVQNDREWTRFCDLVIGRPDLVLDPRFAGNPARVAHREQLRAIIEECFATLTADSVRTLLDSADIANARLRGMHDFAAHPQLEARNRWTEIDSPVGTLRALLPPVTSRETRPVMGPVPYIGEHTESILREFGFDVS